MVCAYVATWCVVCSELVCGMQRVGVWYAASWCVLCGELVGAIAHAQEVLVGDVALAQQQYHTTIERGALHCHA